MVQRATLRRWLERQRGLPADPSPDPLAVLIAVGIGGHLELAGDRLRIVKGGIFGHAVELLWLGHGVIDKTVRVSHISAVEVVKPMLLPDYIRFSYPGSPPDSGHYLDDALAENALIMNPIDNRKFYEIKERIAALRKPGARGRPDAVG